MKRRICEYCCKQHLLNNQNHSFCIPVHKRNTLSLHKKKKSNLTILLSAKVEEFWCFLLKYKTNYPPKRKKKKKAQILLQIKARSSYFKSALWFVYISRPWLILFSSRPSLNPKPATNLSQPEFKPPGNGNIRLRLLIFFLCNFSTYLSLSTPHTNWRKATQIAQSSIGCHVPALSSIGADSQERNEHQTIFPLSTLSSHHAACPCPVSTVISLPSF